jgi:hypothetical protein
VTVPRGLPFRTVDPQALADDPRPERTVGTASRFGYSAAPGRTTPATA